MENITEINVGIAPRATIIRKTSSNHVQATRERSAISVNEARPRDHLILLQDRAPWPNLFQYIVKIDPLLGRRRRRRSRSSQFNSHTSSSLTTDRGDRGRDYRNRERMDLCCGVAETAETAETEDTAETERREGANRRRTMQSSRK